MRCTADRETPLGVTGDHDWVLVSRRSAEAVVDGGHDLLWGCPCGEFRWTSYADWEGRRPIADMTEAEVQEREAKLPRP